MLWCSRLTLEVLAEPFTVQRIEAGLLHVKIALSLLNLLPSPIKKYAKSLFILLVDSFIFPHKLNPEDSRRSKDIPVMMLTLQQVCRWWA